jgi:hypothetical protein
MGGWNRSCWGVGTSAKGKEVRKGYRRQIIVQILGTHVSKWKMILIKTIQVMGEGRK